MIADPPDVRSREITPTRFVLPAITVALALLCSGCVTRRVADEPYSTPGWENHRLPNGPRPYPRLLVEIDSVAGCEPTAAELAALRAFLAENVDKPEGIEVRVDPPIPRAAAAGKSSAAITLAHLSGPADERTAFLYILFTRSSRLGVWPRPTNPYYTFFPYPNAVYIDRAYPRVALFYRAELQHAVLLHEVGHALGLARATDHSKRGHCTRDGCLMREHIVFRFRRWLMFRPPLENTTLCADCRADLARLRVAEPPAAERHWRGYHRRDGTGYTLLTLPGFFYVQFGDRAELDPAHLEDKRRDSLEAKVAGDTNTHLYTSSFSPADHLTTLASLWREQDVAEVRSFVDRLIGVYLDFAEQNLSIDAVAARKVVGEDLLVLIADFPEHRPRYEALRARLAAAP